MVSSTWWYCSDISTEDQRWIRLGKIDPSEREYSQYTFTKQSAPRLPPQRTGPLEEIGVLQRQVGSLVRHHTMQHQQFVTSWGERATFCWIEPAGPHARGRVGRGGGVQRQCKAAVGDLGVSESLPESLATGHCEDRRETVLRGRVERPIPHQ